MAAGENEPAQQVIRLESYEAFAEVFLTYLRDRAVENAQATGRWDEPVSVDLKVKVHVEEDDGPGERPKQGLCICVEHPEGLTVCVGKSC